MKRRTVTLRSLSGLGRFVSVKPIWEDRREVPVCTVVYPEGKLTVWGTGMTEVALAVLPIVVRIAFRLARGRFRWVLAKAVREELSMALRKITAAAPGAAPSGPGAEDAASWPNLWEHLSRDTDDDGLPRQRSTVVIVAGPGGWQGCLSDKDNGRVMWKTSTSVEGLLLALEQGAAEDDPSAWRQAAPDRFKRKK